MASTDAANQAILARIAGMTSHHPAQANLFADWTLEPGDIVTVSSDGTDYSVPVFSMDFTWRGDRKESEVSISATGGQKRDPPSALRRRSYGVARQQLTLEEGLAQANLDINTVDGIAKEARNKVNVVVSSAAGGGYEVNAAAIVTAINGQEASGAISTAKVKVSNTSGDTLDKKITNLDAGMSVAVIGFGTATVSSGQVTIPYYTNGSSSPTPTAAGNISLDNSICDLQITSSGNTYTLQYKMHGDSNWSNVGSFSRATTLSGAWSGRNYTVTASPQGDVKVGTVYDGIVGTGTVSVSGTNVKRNFVVYSEDPDTGDADSVILTKELTIDASSVYNAGVNSVGLVKEAPSGSSLQNQITVSTSSNTKTMTVTAGHLTSGTITVGQQTFTLGYESSSHKYLIAGTAMIGGGSPVSYSTGRTGTEAYDAGYTAGQSASAKTISSCTYTTVTGMDASAHTGSSYTINFTVTYSDATTETASVTVPFSISSYVDPTSSWTKGHYEITLGDNSNRWLAPSGAYNKGRTRFSNSMQHSKTSNPTQAMSVSGYNDGVGTSRSSGTSQPV